MNWESETTVKHKKEAADRGLILLNIDQPKNKYRVYRFIDCKHTQEISLQEVRRGKFKCRTCFLNKIKKEAKERNLTLLKQLKKAEVSV